MALVSLQCCIIGILYLAVAVPVVVAATGLVYYLITAWEMIAMSGLMLGLEAAAHYLLMAFGMLPLTAGPPAVVAAASSLATAASVIGVACIPLLATVLANLILGILAHYRDWHGKMRRWATIVNVIGLCLYLMPQVFVMAVAVGELPSSGDLGGAVVLLLFLGLAALLWDSYFFITLYLWRRMPKRPDIAATIRKMPGMHLWLWGLLAVAWAILWLAAGFPFNTIVVVIWAVVLLAVLPFRYNAKAVGRIYGERRKRYAVPVVLANIVLALFCLVFLPPVGVALALSTVWLCFLLEMTFQRNEIDPDPRRQTEWR